MGDRCMVTGVIGGKFSKALVEKLLKDGWCYTATKDCGFCPVIDEAALYGAACEEGPLCVEEEEVNYANVDAFMCFCQENGIAFHITHGEGEQYSGGEYYWVPGMPKPRHWYRSVEGDRTVDLAYIHQVIIACGDDPETAFERILKHLEMECPMPPVEILP